MFNVKFLGKGQKHTLGEYIDYPRQSNQKLDFEMDIPMSFLSGRKMQLFTAQDMSVIQEDLILSTSQVLTLAEHLRNSSGDKKLSKKT